jgi:hypothetical protein
MTAINLSRLLSDNKYIQFPPTTIQDRVWANKCACCMLLLLVWLPLFPACGVTVSKRRRRNYTWEVLTPTTWAALNDWAENTRVYLYVSDALLKGELPGGTSCVLMEKLCDICICINCEKSLNSLKQAKMGCLSVFWSKLKMGSKTTILYHFLQKCIFVLCQNSSPTFCLGLPKIPYALYPAKVVTLNFALPCLRPSLSIQCFILFLFIFNFFLPLWHTVYRVTSISFPSCHF